MASSRRLSPKAIADIHKLVDDACADADNGLPCASVVLLGKAGHEVVELASHSVGARDSQEEKDCYWLASCTKLVTAIACMQLVEQGRISLDDANQVEAVCPELREVQVLQEDGSLVEKTQRITLRMLLTHIAGFGYSFLNPKLRSYRLRSQQPEFDEFSGNEADMHQPLVNQPGERFEYGTSMDWVGILISRLTGQKLNNYMQQNIFQPLGASEVSMIPSEESKKRLTGIWQRDASGRLSFGEYPLRRPLIDPDTFHSGGAGLFGSPREFSKVLGALLNNGTSPLTGMSILKPETVDAMFVNQLPHDPDFARRHLPAVKPELVYPAEELYPLCPVGEPQGWGLSFMISPAITGRSDRTVHWSGLSNVHWWCDRENGVAGVVGSQVLPFADPQVAALWMRVEDRLYEELKEGNKA